MHKVVLALISLIFLGCQSSGFRQNEVVSLSSERICHELLNDADWSDEVQLLQITERLYSSECYQDSLKLGGLLRDRLRDKSYSVFTEFFSILGPEEMTQKYVLESHERVYLNLLLSLSHMKLHEKSAARVELKRATEELDAVLYNHGRDNVSATLIASLWQAYGEPDMAAPFWKRVGFTPDKGQEVRIYRVGKLSGFNWSLGQSPANGIYAIQPKEELPQSCVSKTGLLVPVSDWTQKMNERHSSDYHPLLNFKTYVRLPIAVCYGATLATTGVAVAVGGCVLSKNSSEGCNSAVEAGGWIMSKVPDVFSYAAKPDLRHWPESPLAFLVTGAKDLSEEACMTELPIARIYESQKTTLSGAL